LAFQDLLNFYRAQKAPGYEFAGLDVRCAQQGVGLAAVDSQLFGIRPVATAAQAAEETPGILAVERDGGMTRE
jgi:hypothetical protein